MDQHLIAQIENRLKEVMSEKRYNHTLGVVDAAIYLAKKYGESQWDAQIAALLHDFAKDFSEKMLKDYVLKHHLQADEILMDTYQLLHGKVAADIAKKEFKITNQNILNAIESHTTGCTNMSLLEKIIYLADFIEVGRDYPGVDELRLLAEENLDKALLRAFNNTITYVISIEKPLHPNTIYARNEILKIIEGAN